MSEFESQNKIKTTACRETSSDDWEDYSFSCNQLVIWNKGKTYSLLPAKLRVVRTWSAVGKIWNTKMGKQGDRKEQKENKAVMSLDLKEERMMAEKWKAGEGPSTYFSEILRRK